MRLKYLYNVSFNAFKPNRLAVFSILATFFALSVKAYDFEVDGIFYNKGYGNVCDVTYEKYNANYQYESPYSGEIIIPETVEYDGETYTVIQISGYAFNNCSNLITVKIPSTVYNIDSDAFENSGLVYIDIPNTVKSTNAVLFKNCRKLERVTISNSLKYINFDWFNGCVSLKDVYIPNSIISIGSRAFCGCKSLKSINIPNSVTGIGEKAFSGCDSLTTIVLPLGVEGVGEHAFSGCKSLESVYVSESVTRIYEDAFNGCAKLKAFYGPNVSDDNRCIIIEGKLCAFAPYGIKSYTIPDVVTSLLESVFNGCKDLSSIQVSNAVQNIYYDAFRSCSNLRKVDLPESIKFIDENAFYGCSSLSSIAIAKQNPSEIRLYEDALRGIPTSTCTLYVPKGSKELYMAADQWSSFSNIVEMTDYITSLQIESASIELSVGDSDALMANILPESTRFKTITWTTSDANVATVDENGYVTAVNPGTATITASCEGKSSTCSINVTPKSISAESIELNTASLTLNIGESETLVATVVPEETTEMVTWASDNDAVATVDQNGLVTGIAIGQTTITAKCGDVSAKCEVTVTDPTETGYNFKISDMNMRKGATSELPIEMINNGEVVAFQCDVVLPDGLSIAQDLQGEYDIQKSDRFSGSHSLQSRKLANGDYRIVSLSMQNKSYQGNDGVLFSIPVVVDESIEAESAIISVENIRMTKPSGEEVQSSTVTANITIVSYTPGDVNGDGAFTVTDAAMIVSYILEQEPSGGIRDAADVNEDGIITVTDAALVVQYILDDKPVNNALSYSQSRLPKASPMESSALRIEDNKAYLAIPNASRFVAGQFELELPMDAEVASIRLVGNNTSSHMLSWQKNADGKIKAVILSFGNEYLSGDEVVEITLDTHGSMGQVIAFEIRFIENEDNEFTESAFCNAEATMDISGIASPTNGLHIFTEGGNLIVISDKEMTLPVSMIDGKVRLLAVHSGRNTYSLSAGFYLIGGQKVFVHYR